MDNHESGADLTGPSEVSLDSAGPLEDTEHEKDNKDEEEVKKQDPNKDDSKTTSKDPKEGTSENLERTLHDQLVERLADAHSLGSLISYLGEDEEFEELGIPLGEVDELPGNVFVSAKCTFDVDYLDVEYPLSLNLFHFLSPNEGKRGW